MLSEDLAYSKNFFHTNEVILLISGLGLPGKKVNLFKKLTYWSYACSLYGISITFFVFEILKLEDTVKDPTKFFSHMGLLFTHLVGILKACLLLFGHDKIRKVMDLLQDDGFRYETLGEFQPGRMLRRAKNKSSNVSALVFFLYSLAGVSAFTSAWTSITIKVKEQRFEGNVTCYDFLPFYFQIPFQTETKSQCQKAFVFMGIPLCAFAWFIAWCIPLEDLEEPTSTYKSFLGHDGIFCALLNCLKTQLNVVGGALTTIRRRTLKKLDLPPGYETLYDDESPELEKALYKELNHCIKHLTSILQARDDLECIFTYITLAQTLGSILIISSCLFVATMVPITSPIFFSQGEYFLCILLQLWLICNFGNEITFSSGQIIRSLYDSDWFSSSLRYKKSMIMIMCRMQRPFYLSIGKFTPLTLITFMAVCRGSFSYFAVFRSIQ